MTISLHEERQIFYYELGLAFTQWAHVEHAFQHAYTSSFKKYDMAIAMGFLAIENFRSKLQVADVAFNLNLTRDQYTEWQTLRTKLRKRSQARNQFAHRYIKNRPENKEGKRVLLMPSNLKPLPNDNYQETRAYAVRDLVLYRYAFYGLSNQLMNFADRISGSKTPFAVPHGLLDRPPPLQTLIDQMRGEPEPPHRPLRG
jgi:hypothetical protein